MGARIGGEVEAVEGAKVERRRDPAEVRLVETWNREIGLGLEVVAHGSAALTRSMSVFARGAIFEAIILAAFIGNGRVGC